MALHGLTNCKSTVYLQKTINKAQIVISTAYQTLLADSSRFSQLVSSDITSIDGLTHFCDCDIV